MGSENIQLVEPTVELEAAFASMVEEYRRAAEDLYQNIPELGRGDFAAYVQRLHDNARELNLKPGYVAWSTFWLVRDGRRILGVSRLRHRLSEGLLTSGGHIGYDIRPSERGKGYGTTILALTLAQAGQLGIRRALVTCLADNAASARIIQKNGGVLQDEIFSEQMGGQLKRYWIDL